MSAEREDRNDRNYRNINRVSAALKINRMFCRLSQTWRGEGVELLFNSPVTEAASSLITRRLRGCRVFAGDEAQRLARLCGLQREDGGSDLRAE